MAIYCIKCENEMKNGAIFINLLSEILTILYTMRIIVQTYKKNRTIKEKTSEFFWSAIAQLLNNKKVHCPYCLCYEGWKQDQKKTTLLNTKNRNY